MKTNIGITAILLLLAVLGPQTLKAADEFSRTVKREYNVNPNVQLLVDNRFGKIHCNNWDKNVISIEVTITVDAPDESAAAKMMDKVTFTLSGTPEKVEARTMISEGGFKKNTHMTIDYTINLPTTASVDLTNRFGDIFLNEISGKGRFILSYGNMDINKLGSSDNTIDVRFGKANVKSINSAIVIMKYSELQIEYAGNIRLDSKFSDFEASRITTLNMNFEGGKLNMEKTTSIDTKSKFSELSIARIEKSLDLDIQYGNCNVDEMPADFTNINIINKYADVKIGLPENASYSLDADLKFCDLDLPTQKTTFTTRVVTPTSKSFHGTVGKAEGGKVTVQSQYGNVSLQ